MSYAGMHALKQYQQTGTYTGVADADPHRLVQMLMQGVLDRIALARGALGRQAVAEKGEHIGRALAILDGLRGALDHERGGELAANLDALYEYMQRRLVEANLENDGARLEEVAGLLREIKSAWDAIPPEQRRGVPA